MFLILFYGQFWNNDEWEVSYLRKQIHNLGFIESLFELITLNLKNRFK